MFIYVFFYMSFSIAIARWSTMTHVGEVQATGTACLDLNTWPQVVIWLLRWVRCVSTSFPFYLKLLKCHTHAYCLPFLQYVSDIIALSPAKQYLYVYRHVCRQTGKLDALCIDCNLKWMMLRRIFDTFPRWMQTLRRRVLSSGLR